MLLLDLPDVYFMEPLNQPGQKLYLIFCPIIAILNTLNASLWLSGLEIKCTNAVLLMNDALIMCFEENTI